MTSISPLETVNALFEALAAKNWEAAVALVDEDSLAAWCELAIASLADDAEYLSQPKPQGGSLRQVLTDPNTVAGRLQAYGHTVFPDLGVILTLKELAALPQTEFFARYLELTDDLRRISEDQAAPHIIGEIVEDASAAYVLYRWEGVGWPKAFQEVSVLRLRNGLNGWRCLLDRILHGPTFAQVAPRKYS